MNELETHLLALSHRIVEIELRRDADALEALICDDYVGVDPSGALIDKAVSVGRYRDPAFQLTRHGIDHVQVTAFGDTAWEVGIMGLAGRLGSFEFGGRYRYTHLWLKTPQGWKVRASQLTPMRPERPGFMHTLLFVFGTLKQGFPNAATNRGARWPGNFRTEAAYPLVLVGDRHVPWLLDVPGTGLPVIGEVYAVDEAALRDMDALERVGHPDGYVRQGITVVPAGIEPGTPLVVQAYLKPANTLAPQDIRLGPLAEYTLAHAALYRRRGD